MLPLSISNTARLGQQDADNMNNGFRRLGYGGAGGQINDRDIDGVPTVGGGADASREVGLAVHFGVTSATVKNWLLPADNTSASNLVIPRDGNALPGLAPPFYGAIGKRVYCLSPYELGKGDVQAGRKDKRNSLRQRIFLGAALCAGGLVRIPIHTGRAATPIVKRFTGLTACLQTMFNIWDGGENDFLRGGWTKFTIVGRTGQWSLIIAYNNFGAGTGSDEMFKPEQEDSANDTTDNGAGCQ